ncbi:unnamed protein product [Paramecium octaurelia]|uniref:Uncharacterized protein n=1 Tax=Paramecium octaurelia TaxID=43137 RepID=A0A8S1VS15_PAROT|nr:unnamed protein product [Paramecium octaurelia]
MLNSQLFNPKSLTDKKADRFSLTLLDFRILQYFHKSMGKYYAVTFWITSYLIRIFSSRNSLSTFIQHRLFSLKFNSLRKQMQFFFQQKQTYLNNIIFNLKRMLNKILLIPMLAGYIISDQGWFQQANYLVDSQFSCQNNIQHSYLVPYSEEFFNVPQITFFWKSLDLQYYPIGFQLEISSINTLSNIFQFNHYLSFIEGLWGRKFFGLQQMINGYKLQANLILKISNLKFHLNIKIRMLILVLQFQQVLHFQVHLIFQFRQQKQLHKMSQSKYKIQKENNQYLNQLGYQIILGPENAFTFIEQRTLSSPFESNQIQIQPQSWFFLILQQLNYNQQHNLYYLFEIYEDQPSISYKYPYWGIFNEIKIQAYWMTYQLTKSYRSLQLKNIEIIYKQIHKQSITPQIQVEISTLSDYKQIFNSSGIFSLLIGKFNNLLVFKISYICRQSEVVKINLQNGAVNNKYQNQFDCNIKINQINYIVEFDVQSDAYQQLILNLTDKNCQVLQILYNQVKSSEKIIELNAA